MDRASKLVEIGVWCFLSCCSGSGVTSLPLPLLLHYPLLYHEDEYGHGDDTCFFLFFLFSGFPLASWHFEYQQAAPDSFLVFLAFRCLVLGAWCYISAGDSAGWTADSEDDLIHPRSQGCLACMGRMQDAGTENRIDSF